MSDAERIRALEERSDLLMKMFTDLAQTVMDLTEWLGEVLIAPTDPGFKEQMDAVKRRASGKA